MLLRSGRLLPFDASHSQLTTMPSSDLPSPSTPSTSTPLPPTIRLLHQAPSFQPYSGDDSFTALTFLQSCEDAMRNSNVTNDADKIAFVRSNLKPNSLASDMMQASAFNPKLLNYDYTVFRKNFLTTFGSAKHQDSMNWVFHLAESLTTNLGTFSYLRGQARAANVANEALDALRTASWLTNGSLTEERLRCLLEFLCYIQFLSPNERRIASSINFKPGDSLMDFGSQIAKKLREAPKASPTDTVSTPVPVTPVTKQPSAPLLCTFCSRTGHLERSCFRRKRLLPKASASPDVSGSQPSVSHSHTSTASSRSPVTSSSPTKWCAVHGTTYHTTEECRAILELRKRHLHASSRLPNQSGEAKRHSQRPPT